MHLKPVTRALKRELYQGQRLSIKLLKPRGEEDGDGHHHRAPRKTYRGNYKGGRDDYLDEGWVFFCFFCWFVYLFNDDVVRRRRETSIEEEEEGEIVGIIEIEIMDAVIVVVVVVVIDVGMMIGGRMMIGGMIGGVDMMKSTRDDMEGVLEIVKGIEVIEAAREVIEEVREGIEKSIDEGRIAIRIRPTIAVEQRKDKMLVFETEIATPLPPPPPKKQQKKLDLPIEIKLKICGIIKSWQSKSKPIQSSSDFERAPEKQNSNAVLTKVSLLNRSWHLAASRYVWVS